MPLFPLLSSLSSELHLDSGDVLTQVTVIPSTSAKADDGEEGASVSEDTTCQQNPDDAASNASDEITDTDDEAPLLLATCET